MPANEDPLDSLMSHLGEFGRYQLFQVFLHLLGGLTAGLHMLSLVAVAGVPEHRCSIPWLENDTSISWDSEEVRSAIPSGAQGSLSSCLIKNPSSNMSSLCNDWVYNTTYYTNTRAMETQTGRLYQMPHSVLFQYDRLKNFYRRPSYGRGISVYYLARKISFEILFLISLSLSLFYLFVKALKTHKDKIERWSMVCERRWMGALAQSVYMLGVFFGAITCGTLADKYGRKTVFCWSALFQLFISTGIALVSNYNLFLCILFFYGIAGSAGAFVTGFVLTMELVGPSKRTVCGLMFQVMFAVGIMLVPVWASVFSDATTLQLVIGAHSLLIFGHWWLMDESPRWLWAQGRINESVNIVAKGVLLNRGPKLDRAHYISRGRVKVDSEEHETAGLSDLFKTPRLRARSLNIALNWFANSLTYYGLALNSSKMEGNPFVNMFVMALVELPSYVIVVVLLDKTGRRSLTSTFMLLGGAVCLLTAIVPQDMTTTMTVIVCIGKFCISGSFAIIFNYSAELFPTVVRNTGIGFGSMCARLAGMLTPIISLLDVFDKRLPILVFASFALVSGFLTLFLPETLNQPMPQSIEDGESFGVGDTAFVNGCLPPKKDKDYLEAKPV